MWNVVPPGGWRFPDRSKAATSRDLENAQTQWLESDTHDNLVALVTRYRTDNHLPPGQPEAEVDAHICEKWPHVCGCGTKQAQEDADAPQLVYGKPASKRLHERVAGWLANRYSIAQSQDGLATVTPEVAEHRASACIGCEYNVETWRADATRDCPSCADRIRELDALGYKITQGKESVRKTKLGSCAITGQDCAVAVWLAPQGLRHARFYQVELPGHCWLKEQAS